MEIVDEAANIAPGSLNSRFRSEVDGERSSTMNGDFRSERSVEFSLVAKISLLHRRKGESIYDNNIDNEYR
jgi:hypothetical protein